MSYSELKSCIQDDRSIGCCQSCRFVISKTRCYSSDGVPILNKLQKFRLIRHQSSPEFLDKLKLELDTSNETFSSLCDKYHLSYVRMTKLFKSRFPDYDLFYSAYQKKVNSGVGFGDPEVQRRCKLTQKENGSAFYSEEVRLRGINTQKDLKLGIFNREFHSSKLKARFKIKYSSLIDYFESINLQVNFEFPIDVEDELVEKFHKEYYFYDLYLPDYNLLIELDGSVHKNNYKDQLIADQLKEEFAISHGYQFLRIEDPTDLNTPFPIELLINNNDYKNKVHRLSSSEE